MATQKSAILLRPLTRTQATDLKVFLGKGRRLLLVCYNNEKFELRVKRTDVPFWYRPQRTWTPVERRAALMIAGLK